MIVDTSAMIALVQREPGSRRIAEAIADEAGRIPAPVIVEFQRVVTARGSRQAPQAQALLSELLAELEIEPFTAEDAEVASAANLLYGAGNGRGGRLNLVDLMVYAVAKRLRAPILCTGTDFASTDAAVHPAGRSS